MENSTEEFKVSGSDLVNKIKEIIKEGNARRIIVKNEKGDSLLEIPLTLGVVGIVLAPYLAILAGLAAVLSSCSIVVLKKNNSKSKDQN